MSAYDVGTSLTVSSVLSQASFPSFSKSNVPPVSPPIRPKIKARVPPTVNKSGIEVKNRYVRKQNIPEKKKNKPSVGQNMKDRKKKRRMPIELGMKFQNS